MMFPLCNSSPRHQPVQGNANVKVVVRVRPLNEVEHNEKYHIVTEAISDHMLVFDPKIQSAPGFLLMNQRDMNRRRFKDLKYAFDYVFGPSATNKDVFEQTTKGIVSGVLNGYNCSVFAYGATGAGKTHTMLGNDREPGVIYYTMIDLYRRINEQKDEKMFDVAVSYSEVYNEQVRDLLMPRGNLPIREDRNIGVIIAGLSLHKPKTADELLHMLQFGNKNRTQHPTDANAESSRSHAVFQVFVNQREKSASVSTEVRMAKMCLVDLAGSERANHSTNCGVRFREGANINRSLLALGNVINALADNKFKGHIPYRDSKLTRLLKDSLGGNCQTVMIAAVSPSSRSFEDTYNTLRYADRAKHIRADLKKNVMSISFHITNYKKYVKELEKENQELRRAKQRLLDSLEKTGSAASPAVSPILRQFQERLKDLFKKRRHIRKAQMESEGAKRELKWKVTRKEQSIKRVQHLTGSPTVIGKHRRIIERMNRRIAKEEQALKDSSHSIQEHDAAIHSTYAEINSSLANGKDAMEVLELNVRVHTIESNLYDSHMYLAFVKKMARAQERQSSVNERLISCLIQLVKKQHDILHSQDLLNNELITRYDQCCYLVEERGVAWNSPVADQERLPAKHSGEETEDFCISDIIDIQIPKLHVQALQGETTPSKTRAEGILQQQPQRVPKPMFAVKPAARVTVGQCFNSGDKRQCPSPVCYGKESVDLSTGQVAAGESVSERESTLTCGDGPGANAVEMLNASLDMCPKRRGFTPVKTGNSPQRSISASAISFGAIQPLAGQERSNDAKGCEENDENANLCMAPGMSNNEWQHAEGSRTSTCRKFSQLQPKSASKVWLESLHEDDDNSGTGNINETFQILQPVLPNTPCIDSSRRHSFRASTPQSHNTHLHTSSCRTVKRLSSERMAFFQRPDFETEAKCDGIMKNSPTARFQSKPSSSSHATSWGPSLKSEDKLTNVKNLSDSFIRQGSNKSKLFVQNKFATNSPTDGTRHSSLSTSGRSLVHPNKVSSPTGSGHDEMQKPESVYCANSNNSNTFIVSATSPKTYADAVKSPVVTRVTCSDIKLRPTAIIKRLVSGTADTVMKTPDFSSNQCMKLVASVLSKPVGEATIISGNEDSTADELRHPLKAINTNKPILRSPILKPNCSSLPAETNCGTHKSQFKIHTNFAQARRNRAVLSGPYNPQNSRMQRRAAGQERPSEENQTNSCDTARPVPSYMQPTFARAQKMLGASRDKPVQQQEGRIPLSRRTLTGRQPLNCYMRI